MMSEGLLGQTMKPCYDSASGGYSMNCLKNKNTDIPSAVCLGHRFETGSANYPLGEKTTERLFRIAADYCDNEGGCHGPDHSERVHATALYIGRQMDADPKILSAAAILHDIGRRHETENQGSICHAAKGAKMAKKILEDFNFEARIIDKILHCIATHRYRGDSIPLSLEAKILFDADKLDSIGAIGIGRAFLFAGQIGARLHNRDSNIDNTESYSVDDTAYREFKVKMSKIKDRMLTPEGKRLAEERHAFMEIFFKRLEREIGNEVEWLRTTTRILPPDIKSKGA